MGYTPVFDSVYHGTLCGRWPTLPVWLTVLPMADRNGQIDLTYQAISALTGWPTDLLKQAFAELMQPDPDSRSDEHEGRRLVPIDSDRQWGWQVVNHSKYREKARKAAYDAERTASGQDAVRKAMSRAVPLSPAQSRAVPLSDSDSDSDSDLNPKNPPTPLKGGAPVSAKSQPRKKPKTALPEGFALDGELTAYASERLPECDVGALFEGFVGKARAKSWVYADWRQAWQEFCRNCAPNSGHWAAGQYPRLAARRWRPEHDEEAA